MDVEGCADTEYNRCGGAELDRAHMFGGAGSRLLFGYGISTPEAEASRRWKDGDRGLEACLDLWVSSSVGTPVTVVVKGEHPE